MFCSVGGVVLVAVFSHEDGANSTSSGNLTDSSNGAQIHETPLGYVVGWDVIVILM